PAGALRAPHRRAPATRRRRRCRRRATACARAWGGCWYSWCAPWLATRAGAYSRAGPARACNKVRTWTGALPRAPTRAAQAQVACQERVDVRALLDRLRHGLAAAVARGAVDLQQDRRRSRLRRLQRGG